MESARNKYTSEIIEAEDLWLLDVVDTNGYVCWGCGIEILPLGKKEVRKDRRLIKCLEKSILTVMQMLKAQWLSRDRKKASATC
ncbi:TPA: hypothetical protein ACM5N8_003572 [Escherichia coli]